MTRETQQQQRCMIPCEKGKSNVVITTHLGREANEKGHGEIVLVVMIEEACDENEYCVWTSLEIFILLAGFVLGSQTRRPVRGLRSMRLTARQLITICGVAFRRDLPLPTLQKNYSQAIIINVIS